MPMPSLSTLPQDIHYHLLSSLSSFADLAATVLAARPLHTAFQTHRARVLSSVARNYVGGGRLFGDALLLVRCQEKAYGYGCDYGSTSTSGVHGVRGKGAKTKNKSKPKTKGLSSGTVRLLVGNARVVAELLGVMWGLVREEKQQENVDSGSGLPLPAVAASETESVRFNSAAYRFCVYCLLPTADARSAFLKRYPKIEVLELSHFVGALWVLVSVIRGRPAENERDWDLVSRAISTGPHNVLLLWQMKEDTAGSYTNSTSTFKTSSSYKFKFRKALKEIEADSEFEFGGGAVGSRHGHERGGRGRDDDDDGENEEGCEDESEDEDEEEDNFMTQWCALMDAQDFPAELRALDAILDADHARLAGTLSSAGGDVGVIRKSEVEGRMNGGGGGDEDGDADSDAVHSDSSVAEGVLKEDRLEDPFDF